MSVTPRLGRPETIGVPETGLRLRRSQCGGSHIDTRPDWHTGMPWRPRLSARSAAGVIGRRPPRPRPLDSIPGSGFRPGTVVAIEATNAEPQGFMGGVVQPPPLPPVPGGTGTGGKDAPRGRSQARPASLQARFSRTRLSCAPSLTATRASLCGRRTPIFED
jgi:hypothetical protein